jgi:hypothetical protein
MGKFNLLGSKSGASAKAKVKAKSAADAVGDKLEGALPGAEQLHGPSPNPATNLIIADVALRGSATLARRAVERGLLGSKYAPRKAKAILKGRTLGETLLHTAIARIAVTSVPGAILVGGGLIAKTLYDRSKAGQARLEGEAKLHAQSKDGEE